MIKFIFRAVFVSAVASLLVSCGTFVRKRSPQPATPVAKKEFERIQVDIAAKAHKKALARLQKLIATHPESDIADDAYILMGRLYYDQRDFESAYSAFMGVVNSDVFSPSEAEALLMASRSLHRLGRLDEALSLTQKSMKIPGVSQDMKIEIAKVRFLILSDLNDRIDALKVVVFIAENDQNTSSRESYRVRAMDFVESRLSEEELESVAKSSDYGFVRSFALFRVAQRQFEQRDFGRARDNFAEVTQLMPDSDLAERAGAFIRQIDSRRQVDSRTIGAVLPLTGRHAAIAQRTLRGLQLGLGLYGANKSDLRLAVVDSEGNPDGARRAVERLVVEDHVIAMVGSLLSRTSIAAASKADELGLPSVALSQKSGLTDVGESVFRNALTSEMQVRELVKTAMETLKLSRFAILYPNDAYGVEFANLFWDEVLARGGQITAAQPYDPKETDFSGPVKRLVGRYYVEDRVREYKTKLSEWYKGQKSLRGRQKPPDDLLTPQMDFEAIFVPDGSRAIGQIAPTLSYYDVQDIRLLGTNLWNSQDLVRKASKAVNGAVFVDSFLTSDPSFTQTRFYKEFKSIFGEAPGPFEAQAYDAGLILRQILASGRRSRAEVMDQLARLSDFPGAVGKLNLFGHREISRPLASLTIDGTKIVRLEEVLSVQQSEPKKEKSKRR